MVEMPCDSESENPGPDHPTSSAVDLLIMHSH